MFAQGVFEFAGAPYLRILAQAEFVERAQLGAQFQGGDVSGGNLFLYVAERRLNRRALRADVLGECVVEPPDRAERRVFTRSAVARLGQRRADFFGARAVDLRRALRQAGRVDEDLDRDAQVREPGVDDFSER